jgi:hypothetical protein
VVSAWATRFEQSDGVSWLAVPGQLALATAPAAAPVKHTLEDGAGTPSSVFVADVDGDGDNDVLRTGWDDQQIVWWRNDGGDPLQHSRWVVAEDLAGASSVHAADVDGDGDVDVLAAAWEDDTIGLWRNQGGDPLTWAREDLSTDFTDAHWVDAADVDGDGDVDVLGAAAGIDTVGWWEQGTVGGVTTWTFRAIDTSFAGARMIVPGDIDADGDIDVVGAALDGDQVVWWSNQGGTPVVWLGHEVGTDVAGAHGVELNDLDGDRDLDIVGAGFREVRVLWWRNQGGDPIAWSQATVGGLFLGALMVDSGDLDGDGVIDVAGAAENHNRVAWWRNLGGEPPSWSEHVLADGFAGAWPLVVADVNDDGALDVVSAASYGGEVAWWRIGQFVPEGTLTSNVLETGVAIDSLLVGVDSVAPPGTAVTVAARWSESPAALGPWVDVAASETVPIGAEEPIFLQYRLTLTTESPESSPIVREVRMTWSETRPRRRPRRPLARIGP